MIETRLLYYFLTVAKERYITNAALLVRAGMGYALIVEGALPSLDCSEVCMVPLYPELTATSILAWKRQQLFSTAVVRFLEHIKCFLGIVDN